MREYSLQPHGGPEYFDTIFTLYERTGLGKRETFWHGTIEELYWLIYATGKLAYDIPPGSNGWVDIVRRELKQERDER